MKIKKDIKPPKANKDLTYRSIKLLSKVMKRNLKQWENKHGKVKSAWMEIKE